MLPTSAFRPPTRARALPLALLTAAWHAPAALHAQAPLTPERPQVRLHVGKVEAFTHSARQAAPDVLRLLVDLLKERGGLAITEDGTEHWLDPQLMRHHGELLRCLNPWAPRREVLSCVSALPFPPEPPLTPQDAQLVLTVSLATSDAGLMVTLQLFGAEGGRLGPMHAQRQAVLPLRGPTARRRRLLAAAVVPLMDGALARPVRPPPPVEPP